MSYPISKNNIQCIGPCNNKNKFIIHPINFENMTSNTDAFCPTNFYYDGSEIKHTAPCDNFNENQNSSNYLYPLYAFDYFTFLNMFYKLKKYEDIIKWLYDNKTSDNNTKLRIIECSWYVFSDDIYIIDNIIIDCYLVFFIENINNIYEKLNKYIDIENNNIFFNNTNLNINNNIVERINYLLKKLINFDEVSKFINRYFDNIKTNDSKIAKNSFKKDIILINFIDYLENKILKSIS